jgi:hypothetical protein
MTPDLIEMLTDAESDDETRLAPTPVDDERRRLVATVRRRRAGRAALRGAGAAGLAAAVGLAVYLGAHAGTPTPPAIGPDERSTAATSADVLGLGALPQADAQTLAGTAAGWALVAWTPGAAVDDEHGDLQANAILLIAPDGTLSHVTDLPTSASVQLSAGRWAPGTTTLDAQVCSADGTCPIERIDLLTGTATPWADPAATGELLVGWAADGRAVLRDDDGALALLATDGTRIPLDTGGAALGLWAVDPTGTRAGSVDFDRTTWTSVALDGSGARSGVLPEEHNCSLLAWSDATHLVASCPTGNGIFGADGVAHSGAPWFSTIDVTTGTATDIEPMGGWTPTGEPGETAIVAPPRWPRRTAGTSR